MEYIITPQVEYVKNIFSKPPACRRCRLRSRAGKLPVPITFTRRQAASADYVHAPASCRCRLRSRAVKRAYFVLTYTAMHAHPVRRRTAPVSYIRRHAPCGALYGYCIKIYKFLFYQALPHLIYSLHRVNKMFGLQSERSGASDNAN